MNKEFSALMMCKVKYDKIDEQSGKEKTASEKYLVDALSFTEAETRINEEMEKYISGEFEVTGITKEKCSDLFLFDDCDKYYKCKLVFIDIDEKSGKEKKTPYVAIVTANDLDHAAVNLQDSLKDCIIPFEVKGIVEFGIIDIFLHQL